MTKRLLLLGPVALVALLLAAPSNASYLETARLTVVKHGPRPTWKLSYLYCQTGTGRARALVSEFTYRQGARNQTYQAWEWGKKPLVPPSQRGSARCSWYHSETHRSRFPQRIGYVNGVMLEIFAPNGATTTRTFRLHP